MNEDYNGKYNKSCIEYLEAKRCEIQERSEGLSPRRSVSRIAFTRKRNSTRARRACMRVVRACMRVVRACMYVVDHLHAAASSETRMFI